MRHVVEYHVEPIPRSLMAAFVAAHPYAVRVRLRMCAAVLLNRRADTHEVPTRRVRRPAAQRGSASTRS